jgi:hypothetical protein
MGSWITPVFYVLIAKKYDFCTLDRTRLFYNSIYLIDSEIDLELYSYAAKSNGLIGLIVALIIVGTTKLFC